MTATSQPPRKSSQKSIYCFPSKGDLHLSQKECESHQMEANRAGYNLTQDWGWWTSLRFCLGLTHITKSFLGEAIITSYVNSPGSMVLRKEQYKFVTCWHVLDQTADKYVGFSFMHCQTGLSTILHSKNLRWTQRLKAKCTSTRQLTVTNSRGCLLRGAWVTTEGLALHYGLTCMSKCISIL